MKTNCVRQSNIELTTEVDVLGHGVQSQKLVCLILALLVKQFMIVDSASIGSR